MWRASLLAALACAVGCPDLSELPDDQGAVDAGGDAAVVHLDGSTPGAIDGGTRPVDAGHPVLDATRPPSEDAGDSPDAQVSDAGTDAATDAAICEQCSDAASPDAQVIRDEVCNFRDDDLDGVVDPDLRNRVGQDVHTQAGNAADLTVGQVALLERAAGGAWFMYRGFKSLAPNLPGSIQVAELDREGRVVQTLPGSPVDGVTHFVADSDGKWLAVASRVVPPASEIQDDSRKLRVQLFRADDLSFVSETVLLTQDDDDDVIDRNDADDCDDLGLLDLGVLEDAQGRVNVAVLHVDRRGVMGASACTPSVATTAVRVAAFENDVWTQAPERVLANSALTRAQAQLERLPCRDEWLVAQSGLHRYSADGQWLESRTDLTQGVAALVGLQRGLARCASEDPSLLFGYRTDLNTRASVRRLSVDRATGALMADPTAVVLPYPIRNETKPYFDQLLAVESPGRWFVSGRRRYENFREVTVHELWEVDFDNLTTPTRVIPLDTPNGARPGNAGPNQDLTPFAFLDGTHAIVDSGESIVVGLPVMYTQGNLDSFRAAGDMKRGVAVTYRVGCAP